MLQNQKLPWAAKGILGVGMFGMAFFLLKGDAWVFLTWWMLLFFIGIGFLPVTGTLFASFGDKGWMFSKALGTAACGFLLWVLATAGILPFAFWACAAVTAVCVAASLWWNRRQLRRGVDCLPSKEAASWIFWQEVLFFLIFLMWTYFAGFRPQAYGTEKFMDYGFMEAMMRSTVLPAADMWYSEAPMNYYYGGQYFAVFLTKLSVSRVELTYNLMRTLVAAFAFSLPCALVRELLRGGRAAARFPKAVPALGGMLAGGAVSLAGNMHYVVYGLVIPWLQNRGLLFGEAKSYWFPDATRYIGHNPDVPDKTIHEFPSYSFVLGDLHAHVVNLMFVTLLLGLLYAWAKRKRQEGAYRETGRRGLWKEILAPELLAAAWLLGMFQWTNFWDFVIYFVVTGGVALFFNIARHGESFRRTVLVTGGQALAVTGISYLAALPFTLTFTAMVQGVALAQNHSRLYQLAVLWGLPFVIVLSFLGSLWQRNRRRSLRQAFAQMPAADLFILTLCLCAMGLVLLPELVYVRDIYEEGSARANTMFKLTYQAYLLFGICMSYALVNFLAAGRRRAVKLWGGFLLLLLCSTFGYLGNAVHSWFGEVWKVEEYQGQDAAAFLETDFPQDAGAIRWLKANVEGSPVVLEANGDSYSDYERVSAMTGLPTVMGWYVHEWLWRNDVEDLNEKSGEIQEIYTSPDPQRVRELLEKYEISYIFVGHMEEEKYGGLQRDLLKSYGEVVYQDEVYPTFIVKVR